MPRRLLLMLLLAVLSIAASACASDTDDASKPPPSKLVLSQSGACGDAFFWAVNPEGTRAVTLAVEVRQRSHRAPTAIEFTVPDAKVKIEIQRGRGLAGALCSDVINTREWHVDARDRATAGGGRLTVGPPRAAGQCGASGRLRLDGLVSSDGTRFAPIDIRTKSIGCYAG